MSTAADAPMPGVHNLTRRQLAGTITGLLLTLLLLHAARHGHSSDMIVAAARKECVRYG